MRVCVLDSQTRESGTRTVDLERFSDLAGSDLHADSAPLVSQRTHSSAGARKLRPSMVLATPPARRACALREART
jgi:hypothetical protein